MNNLSMKISRLSISTLLLSIIAACGGAGGDSGEVVPDDVAIQAVAPLVDVWDLPANWDGEGASGIETFLVIESPDTSGIAAVTIYEQADAGTGNELNCYLTDNQGEVRQSFNTILLDLPVYNAAIAELLPNGDLQISDFAIGATSGSDPAFVFLATRPSTQTFMTIAELPLCS